MNLFNHFEEEDTILRLEDMRSMNSIFIGKLVTGLAFAYSMILMPWFLKFLFAFISVSILVPLGKEYLYQQLKSLRLTTDFLELRRGRRGRKVQRIHFRDVRKIELIEKQTGKNRKNREVRRTIFDRQPDQRIFHPEAKCLITLGSGNVVEVEASYFEEGDFELFLNKFEETYTKAVGSAPSQARFKPRFQLQDGKTKSKEQKETPNTKTARRYQQLIDKNRDYLKHDLALKSQLEQDIIEAYKSVYKTSDGIEVNREPNRKIIYEFKNPDNSSSYILEDNFLANFDAETRATARNLIQAYHKNLRLVETRIAYFKKIEARLQSFMFQEKTRHKLQKLAGRLHNIQEKNTERSSEHPSIMEEDDIDLENRILAELEDLSDEVNELQDLEKAIVLNEHISLFNDREDEV
ncbi:MAG: hypothetical protein AAF740_00960 [Bacteroidota bacterium]